MSPTAQEGEPGKWTLSGRPAILVDRYSARSGRSLVGVYGGDRRYPSEDAVRSPAPPPRPTRFQSSWSQRVRQRV